MKSKGVLVLGPIGSVIPIFLGSHENFELIYELRLKPTNLWVMVRVEIYGRVARQDITG